MEEKTIEEKKIEEKKISLMPVLVVVALFVISLPLFYLIVARVLLPLEWDEQPPQESVQEEPSTTKD